MQGLGTGVDIEDTCQLLRASGKAQVHLGMLRSILTGGIVCGKRARSAGFIGSAFCDFCNRRTVESVHHLFWECPAWSSVRAGHPVATASWRPDWPACFSCCGVLCDETVIDVPPDDAQPPQVEPETEVLTFHLEEEFIADRVVVYTDGACRHNQIAALRRAGYGAWWADYHPANVSKPLPGHVQTNNRAELAAVLNVLQCEHRNVLIKTDSSYVYNGCLKHRHVWAATGWASVKNTDLWWEVHAILEQRGAAVAFCKVKGHATREDVSSGRVLAADKRGNDAADFLATEGAKSNCLPDDVVRDVKHRRYVARAVQTMMVEVLTARAQHVASLASSNDMASNPSSDSLLVSSSSSSESMSEDSYSSCSSEAFNVQSSLAIHSGIDHPT